MTSLSAGINATRAAWSGEEWALRNLAPNSEVWDGYRTRLLRYRTLEHYVDNTVFTTLERQRGVHMSGTNDGLYKSTRPIYNPAGRQVNIYPALVYGGQLDTANLDGGAIPIQTDNEAVRDAIRQLWAWSNWQQGKSVYVRTGAGKGDAFLKAVSQPSSGKVWIENLKPEYVKELELDERGNVKSIVICYDRYDATHNRWHEYEEYIDQDRFLTYRDRQLYAWYEDANGNPVAEWDNEYGFVPVTHAKHRDVGRQFGVCVFQQAIGKIDELNSLASATHDQLRKSVNAVWAILGASKPENDPAMNDKKDVVPWVYFPEGTDAKPMVANLDFASALEVMQAQIDEIEADMPELRLHNLTDVGQMSGVAIETLMMPAVGLITESMGNYDSALVRAQEMAITIGGHHGFAGFESFNLNSYAAGDLQHSIKARSVIRDRIGRSEKIAALTSAGSNPLARLILKELDYSDDEINEALGTQQEAQQNQLAQALAQMAGALNGDGQTGDSTGGNGTDEQQPERNGQGANRPVPSGSANGQSGV